MRNKKLTYRQTIELGEFLKKNSRYHKAIKDDYVLCEEASILLKRPITQIQIADLRRALEINALRVKMDVTENAPDFEKSGQAGSIKLCNRIENMLDCLIDIGLRLDSIERQLFPKASVNVQGVSVTEE